MGNAILTEQFDKFVQRSIRMSDGEDNLRAGMLHSLP
jgi:hypothetical protein